MLPVGVPRTPRARREESVTARRNADNRSARFGALATGGVALALVLAACGEDPSDVGVGRGGATVEAAPAAASAETTAASADTTAASAETTAASAETTAGATTTLDPEALVGGTVVTIANYAFGPKALSVAPGQTVTWTNADDTTQQLIWADGSSSTELGKGQSYKRTFTTPGRYEYYSRTYNFMTGVVVVG